LKKCINFN